MSQSKTQKITDLHQKNVFFDANLSLRCPPCLFQRRGGTCVGSPDAYGFGNGWRDAVSRDGRLHALRRSVGSVNDDGEGNEAGALLESVLRVLVLDGPSRGHLDENVAAAVGVVAVANALNARVARGGEPLAGEHVAYAGTLDEELLASAQHVVERDAPLLQQLVVQINLVAEIALHVAALPEDGSEIDVEQVGRAVDVEDARGNAVLVVGTVVLVEIARAGDHEQHVLLAHTALNAAQEPGEVFVELVVGFLQLGLTFCLLGRGSGVIGNREQIGGVVGTHGVAADALQGDVGDGCIDMAAHLKVSVLLTA